MKKNLRFYCTLWLAKVASLTLKILRRNATYFPGKLAVTLCPDFLGRIGKPQTIIGVTGTNGKTTVCNMIEDMLKDNGYDFMDNSLGANVNSGVATTFIQGSTIFGKAKKNMAVLELDERSAKKIYQYVTPTYLVCTNLFRDSLKRNAHTEFIVDILNSAIPKSTKMILNGDDLISNHLAEENERVYFGIDQLPTDTQSCENITRDIIVCPKCNGKLEYEYVRYNHIGKAHCVNCDFGSPQTDYLAQELDLKNRTMKLKEVKTNEIIEYPMVSDNIINIYNMMAAITVLREMGIENEKIKVSLRKLKIVETRFSEEEINGKKVVMHLAKGQNPIACSRVFDYVRKEPGKKAVILLTDDLHDAVNSTENVAWLYDCDFEFLKDESIKKILVGGARYLDDKVRLLIAGVSQEKLVCIREEMETVQYLPDDIDAIYILHDLYAFELAEKVKEAIRTKK